MATHDRRPRREAVELTLDDIRRRPSVTLPVTMECAGNGRGRIRAAADEPAVAPRGDRDRRVDRHAAVAADRGGRPDRRRHRARLPRRRPRLPEPGRARLRAVAVTRRRAATRGDARLRDERRAAPAAARVPAAAARPGLVRDDQRQVAPSIEAVSEPFDGYQQADRLPLQARRRRPRRTRHAAARPGADDPARDPRLLHPPACRGRRPDLTHRSCLVRRRADRARRGRGGWGVARRHAGPAGGEFAWRPWSFDWDATVGEHELSCRATDAAGNTQPLDPPWNFQGHGNNSVQRFTVTVR